jgi:hypothetical protein
MAATPLASEVSRMYDNFNIVKRILIVRNDSTTAWENSDYVLEKGEIGIGYLDVNDRKRPIMKVGDGVNVWNLLPQSEYIFEKDLQLTHDFGRHKTTNGHVNAGGKGMTLSEWVFDALATTEEPQITLPKYVLSNYQAILEPSNEIGSKIVGFSWEGGYIPG